MEVIALIGLWALLAGGLAYHVGHRFAREMENDLQGY